MSKKWSDQPLTNGTLVACFFGWLIGRIMAEIIGVFL